MSFTPNTTFYLIKDVDIDVSYTHEYYFSDATAQYNFFHSKVFKTVEGGTYQRLNSNVISLPFEADEIREAKYLMWQNANYSTKWYYAFVTLIDYDNPGLSKISYELDVYQTYLFDMNWKESFINRKHCPRWQDSAKTIPTINLEPETLDYGDNYKIIEQESLSGTIPNVSWAILGFSENMVSNVLGENSRINGVPTQFRYYFLPFSTAQDGNSYTFNYNGTPLTDLGYFLNGCSVEEAVVGKLVSVYITPYFPMSSLSYSKSGTTYNITDGDLKIVTFQNTELAFNCLQFSDEYDDVIGARGYSLSMLPYSNYGYSESKLMLYPYSFIEMTNQRGDSLVLHNEYINNGNGQTIYVDIYGSIAYRSTMMYVVRNYLTSISYSAGQPKIYGLTDKSNLDLPIIDDYTASYLQANGNSINVSRSNALATLTTAQANANANNTVALSTASRSAIANLGNSAINALASLGGGASTGTGEGLASGGFKGIANAMTGTISAVSTYKNSLENASTTLANAYRSSQTDYENTIASVNAKVQDAQQVADTSRSMGGDYLFNVVNNTDKIYFFKKTILPEYADKLTAYFKQYGYAYNRVEVPSFHTRASWNYFKMLEPNVSGNIPMNDLLKIRDIFIKGITLWHGDYIGDYSRNNDEV